MNKKIQSLIGLAGRSGSGKDLIGQVIQYLVRCKEEKVEYNEDNFKFFLLNNSFKIYSVWSVKKYADKLKDILCILLGCTRLQLEDRNFKESELGSEWWCWVENISGKIVKPYNGDEINDFTLVKMTPRKLLQVLGTECGRKIIHPNIWVNALFADYKPYSKGKGMELENVNILEMYRHTSCANCKKSYSGYKRQHFCLECINDDDFKTFPQWIITDVRFPQNEGKAVSDRGGVNIGIKRKFSLRIPKYAHLENVDNPYIIPVELLDIDNDLYVALTHESEELMGNFEWCDYVIENNAGIGELLSNVHNILKKENIV